MQFLCREYSLARLIIVGEISIPKAVRNLSANGSLDYPRHMQSLAPFRTPSRFLDFQFSLELRSPLLYMKQRTLPDSIFCPSSRVRSILPKVGPLSLTCPNSTLGYPGPTRITWILIICYCQLIAKLSQLHWTAFIPTRFPPNFRPVLRDCVLRSHSLLKIEMAATERQCRQYIRTYPEIFSVNTDILVRTRVKFATIASYSGSLNSSFRRKLKKASLCKMKHMSLWSQNERILPCTQ